MQLSAQTKTRKKKLCRCLALRAAVSGTTPTDFKECEIEHDLASRMNGPGTEINNFG
jgi:hypothetical protein